MLVEQVLGANGRTRPRGAPVLHVRRIVSPAMRTTVIHRTGQTPPVTVYGAVQDVEAKFDDARAGNRPWAAFDTPAASRAYVAPFAVDHLEEGEDV